MSTIFFNVSRNKRIKLSIITIFVIYAFFSFTSNFSLTKTPVKTEFNSAKVQLIAELEKNKNWQKEGLNFQPNNINRLPIESTLRQQLSYQFPYNGKSKLEKNIWQTWKVGLEHQKFPSHFKQYQQSWTDKNSGYNHFVIPDEAAHELIAQLYESVPDVLKAYRILPKSILKADFFRYLILLARGGTYSDIDTVGLKPIDNWISTNETIFDKPNNAGLIVGIEADPDRPDWNEWYARRIQFCQWTIQAKKGHPMLRELVAKITEITLKREKSGDLNKIVGKDQGGDIMNWTGPGIWTDTVFEYLNNIFIDSDKVKNSEVVIDWKFFTGMKSPIAVDDVLVLPITSFSPGVNQMGAQDSSHPMAYSRHMFSGSWKNDEKSQKFNDKKIPH